MTDLLSTNLPTPARSSSADELDHLLKLDRHHYWHAFTQMSEYEPLLVDTAQGVWLEDHRGHQLIDGVSSMWCNVHGHQHPQIDAAIKEQLGRVAHVTSLGLSNSTVLALTGKLVEQTPESLDCVFYSSDGSSAVEVALKMAFQYFRQKQSPEPDRTMYLALGGAYHGDTLGSVSVGGVARFHAMFDPLLFDVVRGPCPDTYRHPDSVSDDQLLDFYLAEYRKLFEQFGDRLAAVVMEPIVQGASGMIVHPEGFLSGIADLARQYGVLLILDEIAVGLGRTGKMWACEWEDVQPDFLCTGKGLSGGYLPVAATLTTREVWNAFLGDYAESKSFFHGHTYGGNPLGCAAALATLNVFEAEQTLQNVKEQADYLAELLAPLSSKSGVGSVRQKGLIAAVELVANKSTKEPFPWAEKRGYRACEAAKSKGVLLRPLGNSIVIVPPLCVTSDHVQQIVAAVEHGVHVATTV
ncbi:MAG TPA: adenosylmethionine--8-amino-7-oxononanoate transaminase [Planctomycetaceae bacterium]|nr:adenosylmethionine--8-amino-7-oxononanoate transaminase [Planctomycetaceae bacterium]